MHEQNIKIKAKKEVKEKGGEVSLPPVKEGFLARNHLWLGNKAPSLPQLVILSTESPMHYACERFIAYELSLFFSFFPFFLFFCFSPALYRKPSLSRFSCSAYDVVLLSYFDLSSFVV